VTSPKLVGMKLTPQSCEKIIKVEQKNNKENRDFIGYKLREPMSNI
jgi:hypothetical protein